MEYSFDNITELRKKSVRDAVTKAFLSSIPIAESTQTIGKPDPFHTKSLVKILESGLSGQLFINLCTLLDIPEKRLAEVISLPQTTLIKRKKRGYFSRTESERLYRIFSLFKKAVEVFDNNPEYARKWLKSEAYGLDGAIPLDFAKTEVGGKEVENLLVRIDQGIFA